MSPWIIYYFILFQVSISAEVHEVFLYCEIYTISTVKKLLYKKRENGQLLLLLCLSLGSLHTEKNHILRSTSHIMENMSCDRIKTEILKWKISFEEFLLQFSTFTAITYYYYTASEMVKELTCYPIMFQNNLLLHSAYRLSHYSTSLYLTQKWT